MKFRNCLVNSIFKCKINSILLIVLCKPKLLPLKSVTLEKLEKMQKEANEKAKAMQEEMERENVGAKEQFIGGGSDKSESVTFD